MVMYKPFGFEIPEKVVMDETVLELIYNPNQTYLGLYIGVPNGRTIVELSKMSYADVLRLKGSDDKSKCLAKIIKENKL